MASKDLVGLYWTTSGPVDVHTGREWSLFDLEERCAQAQRVGFKGIGLWHADLAHVLETRSLADVAALLDAHGLEYLELEFLMDWFVDGEPRREADRVRALLWEAAAALPQTHHIKAGNIPGRTCDFDHLVESFAALCADASEHHDVPIVYEFMPPDVNVHDLPTALALVDAAGAPNGKLAIDTWHLGKLDVQLDDLRKVPGKHIGWVELSDGPWESMPDLVEETINHRELPGEGEFPIPAYVAAIREAGYDGPWGVEVLSQKLRTLPIDQIFDRSYETSLASIQGT